MFSSRAQFLFIFVCLCAYVTNFCFGFSTLHVHARTQTFESAALVGDAMQSLGLRETKTTTLHPIRPYRVRERTFQLAGQNNPIIFKIGHWQRQRSVHILIAYSSSTKSYFLLFLRENGIKRNRIQS